MILSLIFNNEIESGEKATLVANYEGTEINLTDDVEKQQAAGININDGYCEIRNNGDIISKGDLNIGSTDYLNFRVESTDGDTYILNFHSPNRNVFF